MNGYSDVLVGMQFGDEGKAKIVDAKAGEYDLIARFNGGANAGHTVETEGIRFALNQIPSGVLHGRPKAYIGSGCTVDPDGLIREIGILAKLGIEIRDKLAISPRAPLIQPSHKLADIQIGREIGTTQNGIGPCYADRALRSYHNFPTTVRIGEALKDPEHAVEVMQRNLDRLPSDWIGDHQQPGEILDQLLQLEEYVMADIFVPARIVTQGGAVLFEGAQATMLDINFGTSPFVTSSHTIAGAAYSGGDLPPRFHRKTIGVGKALMSRVGNGPFPTEFGGLESSEYCAADDSVRENEQSMNARKLLESNDSFKKGVAFRILGHDYGTVTGRPRRTGYLDLVQLKYACMLNGVDELFLNKCDLLHEFNHTPDGLVPGCFEYECNGVRMSQFPATRTEQDCLQPVESNFPCFEKPIDQCEDSKELPPELIDFLENVEASCRTKIAGVGVGPRRDQIVLLKPDE